MEETSRRQFSLRTTLFVVAAISCLTALTWAWQKTLAERQYTVHQALVSAAFDTSSQLLETVDAQGVKHSWNPASLTYLNERNEAGQMWCRTYTPSGALVYFDEMPARSLVMPPTFIMEAAAPSKQPKSLLVSSRSRTAISVGCNVIVWDVPRGVARGRIFDAGHGTCNMGCTHDALRSLENVNYSQIAALAPNYSMAAVINGGDGLNIIDIEALETISTPAAAGSPTTCVAFTPDSKMVAAGCANGDVAIWDVMTGELLHKVSAHRTTVMSLAASPSGDYLASGGRDGTIQLYDLRKHELGKRLDVGGPIHAIAISPDARTIAATGEQLAIWHPNESTQIMRRIYPEGDVKGLWTYWWRLVPPLAGLCAVMGMGGVGLIRRKWAGRSATTANPSESELSPTEANPL